MCILGPPAVPIKELICFLDVLKGRSVTDANDAQHLSVSVQGRHQIFLHCDTLLQCQVVCQSFQGNFSCILGKMSGGVHIPWESGSAEHQPSMAGV